MGHFGSAGEAKHRLLMLNTRTLLRRPECAAQRLINHNCFYSVNDIFRLVGSRRSGNGSMKAFEFVEVFPSWRRGLRAAERSACVGCARVWHVLPCQSWTALPRPRKCWIPDF